VASACLALSAELVQPAAADDASPLHFTEAIALAEKANAELPVAALDVAIANQREREAEAERRLQLVLEGDVIVAPSSGYDPIITNLGEERLQLALTHTLYSGGGLEAAVREAKAGAAVAGARYRQALRDVDLQVRLAFAQSLAAREEIKVRRDGIKRLRGYISLVASRQRSGQAVAADFLRAQVRLASDRSALLDAEGRLEASHRDLNTLMGRAPDTALELAPLPPPEEALAPAADAWDATPEVAAARHSAAAAAAALGVAQSERKPHVVARVDAGLWGSDTQHLIPPDLSASDPGANFVDRLQRDAGYSLSVGLTWPLSGWGAIRARIAQAQLALEQSHKNVKAVSTSARLEWSQARGAMRVALAQYRLLSTAEPTSRDGLLEAESRYRGGVGTSLEVIDAFSAALDTSVAAIQSKLAWRTAQALAIRWGEKP